ncbi:hypothetical protein B0H14DRAFT_2596190 [Mycena olivaceomarginata]|nr:hypothetical protein B0H14DRAFT_2596190 [Mycena olivaceomarginata]
MLAELQKGSQSFPPFGDVRETELPVTAEVLFVAGWIKETLGISRQWYEAASHAPRQGWAQLCLANPVEASRPTLAKAHQTWTHDEFTLNFNQGFMTSLWNKTIIQKLCKIFLEKHTAGLGWNLANVMEESQQEWARWQPRFLPLLGQPENESEIHARMERYQDHCQTHVNSHSNKCHKLAKQQKTVAKMIKIKSVNSTPDLEVWHLLKGMLNYLNVGGMSSEENDVENHTGYLRNISNPWKSKAAQSMFCRGRAIWSVSGATSKDV